MNNLDPVARKSSRRLIGAMTLAAVVYVLSPLAAEFGVSGASVQAAQDERRAQKTRRVPAITEYTFKKLSEITELIDLKDYAAALEIADYQLSRRRLNGNEKGQYQSMRGFIFFSMEDYDRAIEAYKAVIEQGEDVPEGLEVTSLYTLAQLSFVAEHFQDALKFMEIWITKADNPGPAPHIFMGQVYYQMKDYLSAIGQIEQGIQVAQERGTPVKENWWVLLNFLYFEEENWDRVLAILEILVRDFPKRDYWVRLAGIHGQLGSDKKQVHAMEAAYTAGFLDRESNLTTLAGLLLQEEGPLRAAKVMEQGFEDGIVEKTSRNLQSLGQAWQLAQEVAKAIPAYEDAAKLSDDGKIYERLAQVYLDDDQFEKCVAASDNALDKGGLRKEQQALIVKGMCQFNDDELSSARKSFVTCRNIARREEDNSNQRMCQQWITYIDRESTRLRRLAESL